MTCVARGHVICMMQNGAVPEQFHCPCKRDRRDDDHAHHRDENVDEAKCCGWAIVKCGFGVAFVLGFGG